MDTASPESYDGLRQEILNQIHLSEASTRALKSRHNELAPISRLPREVFATIFTFLSVFAWNERSGIFAWIYVAHVCHRWRETALNHPHFWSHLNIAELAPDGMVEILSRAKMAPLHLDADFIIWNPEYFEKQLEAHISHTRHLKLCVSRRSPVTKRLLSPAPILEFLSLHAPRYAPGLPYPIIPDNLFNCTAPKLATLQLRNYDIRWKSPLLKGLRVLEIHDPSPEGRPQLDCWLNALNEMPQLKELSLQSATPVAPLADPLISHSVTLPSLTYLHIGASAKDCALALAHLVFPTLTRLRVDVESHDWEGKDVLLVIPYVVQNVCVLQEIEPIRSILIASERRHSEVVTWTNPGADVEVCGPDNLDRSACLRFAVRSGHWKYGVSTKILDALLTLLPTNSISTLTAHNRTRLSKGFWLRHAARLPLLEQARLVSTSVGSFREMLAEDGPQLPMLKRLFLLNVELNLTRVLYLRDTLIKRVGQGAPLEYLDLRTCVTANSATLLAEIVADVRESLDAPKKNLVHHGIGDGTKYGNAVEFDDWQVSWYDKKCHSEDEDEDEDEE